MKAVSLDTNFVISFLKGDPACASILNSFSGVYLSYVVVGELLYGALNSDRAASNLSHYKRFIEKCRVLHSNTAVSEEYAAIRTKLKRIGKPIPENDIWIAATSMAYDLPLLTFDKHLSYVEGLKITSPN